MSEEKNGIYDATIEAQMNTTGLKVRFRPGQDGYNIAGEFYPNQGGTATFKLFLVALNGNSGTPNNPTMVIGSYVVAKSAGVKIQLVNNGIVLTGVGAQGAGYKKQVCPITNSNSDLKISMGNLLFDHEGKEPAFVGADDGRAGVKELFSIAADLKPDATGKSAEIYVHFESRNSGTEGDLIFSHPTNNALLLPNKKRYCDVELEVLYWKTDFSVKAPCS